MVQQERLGTAHAALQAAPLFGDGEVAVLYADNPLIQPETLHAGWWTGDAGDAGWPCWPCGRPTPAATAA